MKGETKKRLVYATPLMKGWQMREACKLFRAQEAMRRRHQFAAVPVTKEASASAGERVGSL